jgi:hypothetical protein
MSLSIALTLMTLPIALSLHVLVIPEVPIFATIVLGLSNVLVNSEVAIFAIIVLLRLTLHVLVSPEIAILATIA